MTTILSPAADKAHSIDLLQEVLTRFVYPGIPPDEQALLTQHLAWMRAQTGDLRVTCKLETVPGLQLTRITLDAAFQPIPSLRKQ